MSWGLSRITAVDTPESGRFSCSGEATAKPHLFPLAARMLLLPHALRSSLRVHVWVAQTHMHLIIRGLGLTRVFSACAWNCTRWALGLPKLHG